MRSPPRPLVNAVILGSLSPRIRRGVLHYRGHFRALDKDGALANEPEEIVRIEIMPRARKEFGL